MKVTLSLLDRLRVRAVVRAAATVARPHLAAFVLSSAALVALVAADSHVRATTAPSRLGAPHILYTTGWSGSSEIYSVDPRHPKATGQLTPGRCCSYDLLRPSPDGQRVVFLACEDGTASLFVSRADGATRRRFARVAKSCYYPALSENGISVAWAADSRRIAYTIDQSVHVVNADGSGDRAIDAFNSHLPGVGWSPDGHSLAFLRSGGLLQVMRDRGPAKSIATAGEFSWSPSGKWIAYDTKDSPSGPTMLYVVRPDGSGRRRLTAPYYGFGLKWSADGRYLAFWSAGDGVGIIDPVHQGVRYITDGTLLDWAPASHRIATSSRNGISVFDLDNGTTRLLTPDRPDNLSIGGGAYAAAAKWSPDGRRLAYVVLRSDFAMYSSGDLRVVSLDGTVRTVVHAAGDYGGQIYDLAWGRPVAGVKSPPAAPRSVATVSSDQLAAPWTITALAADGDRVAYVSCGHVFAWTPTTGAVQQTEPVASLGPYCSIGENYVAYQIYSLAIARDRVAYAQVQGNTGKGWDIIAWQAGSSSQLARGSGSGDCTRGCMGELVGGSGLLAYSSWDGKYVSGKVVVTTQGINRVDGIVCPCATLRTDPGPLVPLDADGDRIVAGGNNATVILDSNGNEDLSVSISPLAAALSGNGLVILRQGELLDFDARDGSQIHRWPLPNVPSGRECGTQYCRPLYADRPWPGPRLVLEDTARGLAVYILDGQVHVLRLIDGKDQLVGAGRLARFMDAGLVYADGARLHLIPYERLPLR